MPRISRNADCCTAEPTSPGQKKGAGKKNRSTKKNKSTKRNKGISEEEDCWRVHVTIPGLLYPSVRQRWAEFDYPGFSPYAVELVCYDLRKRCRRHWLTQPLSRDLPHEQDAVDLQIVNHYRPGLPRDEGLLLRLLSERDERVSSKTQTNADTPRTRKPAPQSLSSEREHIEFPGKHRWLIDTRRRELGYRSLSKYVTGLIRYDLALSGPHHDFNGADSDPEMLAALDNETAAMFREGHRERIRLIDFIEEATGRELTEEESVEELGKLLERLRGCARQGR
jgi:hypothetical protein